MRNLRNVRNGIELWGNYGKICVFSETHKKSRAPQGLQDQLHIDLYLYGIYKEHRKSLRRRTIMHNFNRLGTFR